MIEKSVLWALLQMNARPDLSAPTARLQVLINDKGKRSFWDFNTNKKYHIIATLSQKIKEKATNRKTPLPYLFGLETLLKEYSARHSLLQLAQILDGARGAPMIVEKELEAFLKLHQSQLNQFPRLKQTYFKGDEILTRNESLPRVSYTQLIQQYHHLQKSINVQSIYRIRRYLYPFTAFPTPIAQGQNISILCNQDLQRYENAVYLVAEGPIETNTFGLQSETGQSFLASSTQSFQGTLKPLGNSFLLEGNPHTRGPSMCLISQLRNGKNISLSLVSGHGRDPGQFLFHLIKGDLLTAESLSDVDRILRNGRYLFLLNPLRLNYESTRGKKSQLYRLLQLDVPIYHVDSQGDITAHAFFAENSFGLINDDRVQGYLYCGPHKK